MTSLRSNIFIVILLLSGCSAAWSPNFVEYVDEETQQPLYEVSIHFTYPQQQFMTREEWDEYRELTPHEKTLWHNEYSERQELEQRWADFISNCLLDFTLDC